MTPDNHPPVHVPMVPVPTAKFTYLTDDNVAGKLAALTVENERLRADLREAVGALAKIADHGKGFTDEQMHLRIYAATYYRWAKSEADAVVAKHRKGESDVL